MSGVPAWLGEARARATSWSPVPRPDAGDRVQRPSVGDLRSARPMDADAAGHARLVAVLDVHPDGSASVALVTDEHDLATSEDVVLDTGDVGASFGVTVQLGIVGPVWWAQLGPRVGRVELDRAAATGRRGVSLVSDADPRWAFKDRELDELRALAADCLSAPVDEEPPLLDPAVAAGLARRPDRIARLVDEAGRSRVAPLTASAADRVHRESMQVSAGVDELALLQSLLMGSLGAPAPPTLDQADRIAISPERVVDPVEDDLDELVATYSRGDRRSLRLVTDSSLWSDTDAEVALATSGRRRLQILLEAA